MKSPAFVYTELQIHVPFAQAPWKNVNAAIRRQPGFRNKTWLAGAGSQSLGGFYEFDSVDAAQRFVVEHFPAEARSLGVPQTTRIFDGAPVADASVEMRSPHFGVPFRAPAGAFVYTEVQVSVPFENAPWRVLNPTLLKQPGLLAKTWLAGLNTGTLGGLYAFDTLANATRFATDYFPTEIAPMRAGFTTRVFDATHVREASRELASPYFA